MAPLAPTISVYPSAGWLLTKAAATAPPPPGLFSTIAGWPEGFLQLFGQQTRDDIVAAAGRKADDDAQRLVGVIGLRECCRCGQGSEHTRTINWPATNAANTS